MVNLAVKWEAATTSIVGLVGSVDILHENSDSKYIFMLRLAAAGMFRRRRCGKILNPFHWVNVVQGSC